mgnify:CR=1 FL=1
MMNDNNQTCTNKTVCLLNDSLSNLIEAIKKTHRMSTLTVKDIMSHSNKIVDLSENTNCDSNSDVKLMYEYDH